MWTTPTIADVLNGGLLPSERATLLKLNGVVAGTVAVTNNSAAFVGTGTAFTVLQPRQTLLILGVAVVIQSVADDAHFTATAVWAGTTASGLTAGVADSLVAIVNRVINKIRGAVTSGGYDVDTTSATSIPPDLFDEFVSICVWRYVTSIPDKTLATDARKEANADALDEIKAVIAQKHVPEVPVAGTTDRGGVWNSENKLILRTHPLPPPSAQFPQGTDDYANPNAPEDNT